MERYRRRQVHFRAVVAPLLTGDQVSRFEAYMKEQENDYRQRMKLFLTFTSRGKAANQ